MGGDDHGRTRRGRCVRPLPEALRSEAASVRDSMLDYLMRCRKRSPYNTLNANLHAAESLAVAYSALRQVYGLTLILFLEGVRRAVARTLPCQWADGCLPYREGAGVTINYTSLVLWCLLDLLEALPDGPRQVLAGAGDLPGAVRNACAFLRGCVDAEGRLLWERNETSTAKYNLWTYLITANVLARHGDADSADTAARLLRLTPRATPVL